MNTFRKTIIIIVLIILGLFGAFSWMKYQTKKISPETTVSYAKNNVAIEVKYSQPAKKGRVIFGSLVPYGKVWRTGANEPTIFSSNKNIEVDGKFLKAGKYTLWTIPGEKNWTIIFNNKQYRWGIGFDGAASRDPAADELSIIQPVEKTAAVQEQFSINFNEVPSLSMVLQWENTKVEIPISY